MNCTAAALKKYNFPLSNMQLPSLRQAAALNVMLQPVRRYNTETEEHKEAESLAASENGKDLCQLLFTPFPFAVTYSSQTQT